MDFTYENEYELKRHILQQSEKIIVVTDKNKFNTQPEYTYCKFKSTVVFCISNTLTKEKINPSNPRNNRIV